MAAEDIRIQSDDKALMERFESFRQDCLNQVNGFRREDLACFALSICAPRRRMDTSELGYVSMESQQDSSDRQRIIDKLYSRVEQEKHRKTVSREQFHLCLSKLSWALLQIINIDELRKMEHTLDSVETIPDYITNIETILEGWSLHFKILFAHRLSDDEKQRVEASTGSKTTRSKKIKKACRARDEVCILTGCDVLEAVHIYPFNAVSASNFQPTFKETIVRLWGEGREKAISEKLFPDGTTKGIDVIGNVLSFSPDMRAAWSRYDFALWPMPPTKEKESGPWSIQVVFYWLHNRRVNEKMLVMGPDFKTSAKDVLIRPHISNRDLQTRAVDLRINAPILDGQIFTIHAAEQELLPDYDILMLQWDIARMASLCGATTPDDDSEDDSDSDSDSDYDVENTGLCDTMTLCHRQVDSTPQRDNTSSRQRVFEPACL